MIVRERGRLLYDNPRLFAEKNHGLRVRQMDLIQAPAGWVVNGRLDSEIWDNIQAVAIPVMPGEGDSQDEREARGQLQKIRRKYGEDAFMLMLRDDETEWGWSTSPVLPSDLDRKPEEVLGESLKPGPDGKIDFFLAGMKRHAFMAATGWVDTQ